MHTRWQLAGLVFCLSGCALLGPGADSDDDEETEEAGNSHIVNVGGTSGIGGAAGVSGIVTMPPAYTCFEGVSMCSCNRSGSSPGRCQFDWACCIESEDAARCECFESEACDAEVASRPGAKRVETCPAGAAQIPVACAEAGQNCTRMFLEQEGLERCCDGLVCAPNASGVRTCRAGTDAEIAFAEQCADNRSDGLTATGTLATSEGEIPIASIEASLVDLGTDGCVAGFDLALSPAADNLSPFSCSLRAKVGPARDAEGRAIVSGLQLIAMTAFGCSGFPAGVDGIYSGGTAAGTLAFEGLTCEGAAGSEQCAAGRFTLTLDGELTGMRLTPDATTTEVTLGFDEATLTMDGRLCDFSPEGAACAAAP